MDAVGIHGKAIELAKLVLRMTTNAGSGHPSSALALCHIVVELMYRQMRFDPTDPWNPASDRLVLSAGHAVPIVYAAYADLGGVVGRTSSEARRLTADDLNGLRELDSVLDGHPNPAEGFPFFDAATGSLGQGLSVAAGLALAARLDGSDRRIFCVIGDGESREGQIWEAADFIVDHCLNRVCAIFSCNGHGQAGPVSRQQFADVIAAKASAFGWRVQQVDGHDPVDLAAAFEQAAKGDRPTAVVATTVKGWGVDLMIGRNYHGKPLTPAELEQAMIQLGANAHRLGAAAREGMKPTPSTATVMPRRSRERIELPSFEDASQRAGFEGALRAKRLSTRAAYGVALVALGDADRRVVALDGDVSNSTFSDRFAREHPDRFFECKIAEQNMISVAAGLAAAGRVPFASSFGKFIARASDQIDMAAITRANIKIVGSHCGVSLAADGPSQMSVSDLAYFRSLTRVDNGRGGIACHVFQPADAVCAYRCCELMANIEGLCYLRTHRPDAPMVYPLGEPFDLCGWKQLRKGEHLTIASSGYMLQTVLDVADRLAAEGVHCSVFDVYAFPVDATPILEAAQATCGAILTVEDNYLGGLHAEMAEAAAALGAVRVVGMTGRRIPKSAKTAEEVFTHLGIGSAAIMAQARTLATH